jgi:hypothetical protein
VKRFFPILLAFHFLANVAGCPATTTSTATCAAVCAKGAEIGCVFAKPTPKGATCETVCANLQASGLPAWDLACRSTKTTCAAMDACERGR